MSVAPETLREVADFLKQAYLEGEAAFVIAVGGVAPTIDCDLPMTRVWIQASVYGKSEEFFGTGINLESATCVARLKLRDRRASIERERHKAKKDRKERLS